MHQSGDTAHFSQRVLVPASSMLAYWDTDLVCRYASTAYQRWFGASNEQVVGRRLEDLLGAATFSVTQPHISAVLKGRAQVVEAAMLGPDGQERRARAHYHPDVVDTVVVGFVAEVAELVPDAGPVTPCPASMLEHAMASARLGLWRWDLERRIVLLENARAGDIFGIDDAGEWFTLDAFCADHMHPDDVAGFCSALDTFALTGAQFYFQGRYRRRGEPGVRWFECFGELLDEAAGRSMMVGTVADITGRMTTGQALLRSLAELTETQVRRDEFIAILGHELRNCLAPISAGVHALGHQPPPAMVARIAGTMGRQVRHMARLVDDIYALRLEQGNDLAIKRSVIALNDVVHAACDIAMPAMQAAGHHLALHLPETVFYVDGDLVRLTQALSNLLCNAAKFTPSGGLITLTMQAAARGMASITVADNGVGIAPNLLETVFGMYVKAPASVSTAAEGLGIGLFLSRRLVQLHGGTLTASSKGAGQGTTMTMRLPMSDSPV